MSAPDREVCRVNPVAQRARAAEIKAAPFFPVPLSAATAYVLVIRSDFSDQPMSKSRAETEAFMEDLKRFYSENSYGVLTVSATVTSTYRMPQTLASYAQGICSNFNQLAKQALALADPDYNLAPFDHIMIYHAGIGAETAGDSGCQTDNVWSVFAPTIPPAGLETDGIRYPMTYDGRSFNGAVFVPESEAQGISPLGVICHEYGHQLGLPDIYKAPTQPVVGKWSLMDGGIYLGAPQGSNPGHLDAWSKKFLGFSNPQIINVSENSLNVSLEYAERSAGASLRIPISGVAGVDGTREYFLVERRGRRALTGKAFDDALPYGTLEEGYLIWHVDDGILTSEARLAANNVNSGSPNYGLDLIEAGGPGPGTVTSGEDSDPFPGGTGKNLFAFPHSNAFGGQQTGITLSGFYAASLTAKKAFSATVQEIAKLINFPNPGGPSYAQKQGAPPGTYSTIVLHVPKPAQTLKLTIHDISGLLVRDVPEHLIHANGGASADQKFVYEYEWDGRTDSGEKAAPGTYLYRLKVDDSKTKTGKLVIIR